MLMSVGKPIVDTVAPVLSSPNMHFCTFQTPLKRLDASKLIFTVCQCRLWTKCNQHIKNITLCSVTCAQSAKSCLHPHLSLQLYISPLLSSSDILLSPFHLKPLLPTPPILPSPVSTYHLLLFVPPSPLFQLSYPYSFHSDDGFRPKASRNATVKCSRMFLHILNHLSSCSA